MTQSTILTICNNVFLMLIVYLCNFENGSQGGVATLTRPWIRPCFPFPCFSPKINPKTHAHTHKEMNYKAERSPVYLIGAEPGSSGCEIGILRVNTAPL